MRIGTPQETDQLIDTLRKRFDEGWLVDVRITTPHGVHAASVRWLEGIGLWAKLSHNRDETVFNCYFGHSETKPLGAFLTMSVQMNLPLVAGRATLGAAIVDENTELCLGHRGRLGGGRATVSEIEFRSRVQGVQPGEITCHDGRLRSYFILGPCSSVEFAAKLSHYVSECARIRYDVRSEREQTTR